MELLKYVEEQLTKESNYPDFRAGDNVTVSYKIIEGSKERIQAFRGDVIQISGESMTKTFTVRKMSNGVGVERIFPIYSPLVEGVEVVRRGKVRRAKLYYLRERRGKSARIVENSGTRAKRLNDEVRQKAVEEKARAEAEKIASAEALAKSKAAEEAAAAKAAEEATKAAEAEASNNAE